IYQNQTVAIVGRSGCGKSTLLKLMLGFYRAQQGSIYFDDKDISLFDPFQLRSQFGVVLQNDQLIPGDIFSNIVGVTNLSLDAAWEAAKKV
ncbi:ATP-binding cassette domain-containing protein, partial [Acinetobacter baumannii]